MIWVKRSSEVDLGFLPTFLSEADPRPAKEQLHENYQHGGGWVPFHDFKLQLTEKDQPVLIYPGDPPMHSIAFLEFREEIVFLFPYSWVVIIQTDGSYEVARMD